MYGELCPLGRGGAAIGGLLGHPRALPCVCALSGASTRAIALRARRPPRSSRAAGALPWRPVTCAHVPTAPLNALWAGEGLPWSTCRARPPLPAPPTALAHRRVRSRCACVALCGALELPGRSRGAQWHVPTSPLPPSTPCRLGRGSHGPLAERSTLPCRRPPRRCPDCLPTQPCMRWHLCTGSVGR